MGRAILKTAQSLESGTFYAVKGILAGGKLMSAGVSRTGDAVRRRLGQPVPEGEGGKVSQRVRSGVKIASKHAPKLVWVSTGLIDTLIDFAVDTGKFVGDKLSETSVGQRVK